MVLVVVLSLSLLSPVLYCSVILHLQVVSEWGTKVIVVIMKVKMDPIVLMQKEIMLNADQYGHWKARMKHMIRGINEDVWTAVEICWEEPTIVT